jgi:hypothetical protein
LIQGHVRSFPRSYSDAERLYALVIGAGQKGR